MRLRIKKIMSRGVTHLFLIILTIVSIFPLYWMIISSVKDETSIFQYDLIPKSISLASYVKAITTVPLFRMMMNSVVVSLGSAIIQLTIAVLFAYAFTRWNFKGKTLLYSALSIAWLIPVQAIMVPNYIQINNMGLNNTLLAMLLPGCCSVFANITMYQNFNSMPKALLDAARLDGSSELQILKDIVLPNMRSSVASLGIVLMINAWNDYLWPTLIARTTENSPVQIGLKSFTLGDTNMWGSAMAAATISCIPILIAYLFMSRQIMDSFMKGGIK